MKKVEKINVGGIVSDFMSNLKVPDNDRLRMHPSLLKGNQLLSAFENKVTLKLQEISVPVHLLSKASKYYPTNSNYLDLEVGSMFITGPVHSGKTLYLISKYVEASIISASYAKNRIKLIYIEHDEMIRSFKKTITDNSISESVLYEQYMDADVLFIDDIFASGMNTEYAISILYTILNHRHSRFLPTLVTTNLTESNISDMENGSRLLRRLMEHADIKTFTIK